jgi:alpha-beta hydrolase superfamily lysophospholipase
LAPETLSLWGPMKCNQENVRLKSLGDELAGVLFLPVNESPAPVLIICHGAGEFKENYFELCELLASRGVATLAIDMHGHGESAGERFYVNMCQWVADVQAAIDYLLKHPRIHGGKIGAFGLSSGGTAILEAAMVDPRLKALVALDATVRNSLPLPMSIFMQALVFVGKVKKLFTNTDLRLPLAKMSGGFHLASDPELDKRLQNDPRALAALNSFPFPGAAQAFFVNTLKRVSKIGIPTLVLWGAEDKLDPPETGKLLFEALTCKKQLHIIAGNGHVGHLDTHKDKVFSLTADWMLENLV